MVLPLDMLQAGEWGEVAEIAGQSPLLQRLAEMGLRTGCRIRMVQPGTPCLLDLGGCKLCLRADDCSHIYVRVVSPCNR
ncbi:MAG: FeoA family protein [Thermogemmata sp.]|uniref:Ferrous iron transport protein A n=2 Tax=Thermogemmata fonticola TaxID=2755323 RepID=A0A7V8VBU5_9BACT|nr:ferrous iron transport protein A [Thermogemmata fonticola]